MNQLRQEAQAFMNKKGEIFSKCIGKASQAGSGEQECLNQFRENLNSAKPEFD
eukprot:CAMPEP_0205816796 /NCGR_PEP_ID=MMETSP0205-20121125/23279_1 /ASSEMBLY_ACC=CAM_ASM_000278 /TAXON_ID=36767 /ORGANISM="Euplotes focardii, Strain TN1" /LENGTH=52 /DNA_ID=CAMNT_0053105891 /DNA_START=173 /DNA_END=328 /DNA_ORIENTATION=+